MIQSDSPPREKTLIYAVIPAHNRKALTLSCLERLSKVDDSQFDLKIVVVDDGSTDGTDQAIKQAFPEVELLKGNGNLWWSGATNLGVMYGTERNADYVLTLNDDVDFSEGFIEHMLGTACTNPNTIVCALVCYETNREIVMSAGRWRSGRLRQNITLGHAGKTVSSIGAELMESELENGYTMLIPKAIFDTIGFFDDNRFPHHMGDMDFVLRARECGYRVLVNPHARVYVRPGHNYLYYLLVHGSTLSILRGFIDKKSSIFLRTRLFFIFRHSKSWLLALIATLYFFLKMIVLIIVKLLMPRRLLVTIGYKLYGKEIYQIDTRDA
jgi:GT2 family glycosyltransferase